MSSGKCELCNRYSCECLVRIQAKVKEQEQKHKNLVKLPSSTKPIKGSRDGHWKRAPC